MSSAFDPAAASLYGRFVQAAYTMYGADPTNLTPPQSNDFPSGYRLVAWITMQDFIIGSTAPLFYGFIAGSTTADSSYVLAIRGTSNGIEWWDDINAVLKQPFKVAGCGAVASAFARIYDTLEVLHPTTGVTAARPQAESMKSAGAFDNHVAASIRRHTAMGTRAAAFFFQAEDGIRDYKVTGVQTCPLPILCAHVTSAAMPHARIARLLGNASRRRGN